MCAMLAMYCFGLNRQRYQISTNQNSPSYANTRNLCGCTIALKRMRTMLVLL